MNLFLFDGARPADGRTGRVILARLLREAVWAPAAVLLLYYLSNAGAYRSYGYWAFHFLGGAALAFFFFRSSIIAGNMFGRLRPLGRHLLAFACACSVATFWEVGEFAYDQWMGTRMQRNLFETMIDLVFGIGGAAAGLLMMEAARQLRRQASPRQ